MTNEFEGDLAQIDPVPALEGLDTIVVLFPMVRETQTDTKGVMRLQASSGRRGGADVRKLNW